MQWVLFVCRLIVGGLFVLAGVIKLRAPQEFANSIKAFRVFPEETGDHLVMMSTFTMPWLELICGLLLIVGWRARDAALVIGGMLVVFIVAVVSVLVRRLEVDCGCFGELDIICEGPIGVCGVTRNVIMLAMCVAVLLRGAGALSVDSVLGRGNLDSPGARG